MIHVSHVRLRVYNIRIEFLLLRGICALLYAAWGKYSVIVVFIKLEGFVKGLGARFV